MMMISMYLLCGGGDTTSVNCGYLLAYCLSPRWCMSMETRGEMTTVPAVENFLLVHLSHLVILPAESSRESRNNGRKNWWFSLSSISVHTCKWFLTYREILRHGASGFISCPKEGVLFTLLPLKVHASTGSEPPLGSMTHTLTTTPPRQCLLV
jgi:hypothetical protein